MAGKSLTHGRMAVGVVDKIIPIEDAARIIHDMVPDDASEWRRKIFSPDYLIERAVSHGASIANSMVADWDRRGDDDLVTMILGADNGGFSRDVLIITDLCLAGTPRAAPPIRGGFLVSGPDIRRFIDAYKERMAPSFIDGDVILASPGDRRIVIFHHEGVIVRIDFP